MLRNLVRKSTRKHRSARLDIEAPEDPHGALPTCYDAVRNNHFVRVGVGRQVYAGEDDGLLQEGYRVTEGADGLQVAEGLADPVDCSSALSIS